MAQQKPPDRNDPKWKAVIDEVVHGTYVKEGTMVAFPLCFPGASAAIPGDESHVTALDTTADGIVYGGCGGRGAHLFVGMFHGVTGYVFDMAQVEAADECAAMCCGEAHFVAAVNGPQGGQLLMRDFQRLPFDCIQEWGFMRTRLTVLPQPAPGEKIIHAVRDASRQYMIGVTQEHLFLVDIDRGHVEVAGQIKTAGKIVAGLDNDVFGLDEPDALWRYSLRNRKLERNVVKLPRGDWQNAPLVWARDHVRQKLYVADSEGRIFSLLPGNGFSEELARTNLAPVTTMAVTHDGRVFGFCGEEMSSMFCYNPDTGRLSDLGVAASVLERRRYGYVFSAAVTGRDGQIYFGEDDDLGHLWIYFPAIQGK